MYKTCYLGLRVTDFLKKGYVGGGGGWKSSIILL